MTTKFRIGYPYASASPEETRETVVFLEPNKFPGYTQILKGNSGYSLPSIDPGPRVLLGCNNGVVGHLIESEDERRSIAKNIHGQCLIHGQGESMQLALVLAVCAKYQDQESLKKLPLLIFSAAIERPHGAPPFLCATINTYCSPEEAKHCLYTKYRASQMANAEALILPKRDADILEDLVYENENVRINRNDNISIISTLTHNILTRQRPLIIGISQESLPDIAEYIGNSRFHYKSLDHKPIPVYKYIFWLLMFLLLILLSLPIVIPTEVSIKIEIQSIYKEVNGKEYAEMENLDKLIEELYRILGYSMPSNKSTYEHLKNLRNIVRGEK